MKNSIPSRINGKINPEYARAYYIRNHDAIRQHNEVWRKTHKYKGIGTTQYRAMVIALLLERDGTTCGICHLQIDPGQESPDHIVQRAKGGSNAASNLRLVHLKCNQTRAKWNRRMEEQ